MRRFEIQSLLRDEGLVEGAVGTPRPLTGYKREFATSFLSEHIPRAQAFHDHGQSSGKAEWWGRGSLVILKDANVTQSLLCLSKREQ